MPLAEGAKAPHVALPTDTGWVSIDDLIETGAAQALLLVFFKTACPACAATMPLVGTLGHHLHGAIPTLAVSEDPLATATEWLREQRYAGHVASDAYGDYAAARRFQVRVLPTLVLITGDRRIDLTVEAWNRTEFNRLAVRAAELADRPDPPLSTVADGRPDRRAGCWSRRRGSVRRARGHP